MGNIAQETARPVKSTDDSKKTQAHRRQRRLKIMMPILMLLVFLVYAYTTNFIPSESMLPTLKPGDHIVTMRAWLAYPGGRAPRRGDIIVFLTPKAALEENPVPSAEETRRKYGFFRREAGDALIKRVVGLPGETVQIWETGIFINGRQIASPLSPQSDLSQLAVGYYGIRMPLKLRNDEIFVLGDNPGNSDDSRFWGPVKLSSILGRYTMVLFHEGANGPNVKRAREEAARENE